ncbi:TetR/AcrR family transcriptional regulator [Jannaschia sp. LMIT008]|uniref:TetR/AcrR family transcriptional regulator n=1 Tax=Jannaschia maritima TaxID=3032585 RepID=UPI002811AA1E|nr:TetR/AcrR family transcriptional regulator [Jannaschia sp. LMIT008]
MARPRNFDEDEALGAMVAVFWHHGYDATTMRMLEEATGIGVRGIANVFGDKEAIFLRVLATYHAQARGVVGAVLEPPSLDGVRMLFGSLAAPADGDDVRNSGCLMVNTVFELGRTSAPVREAVEAYRTMWRDAFAACCAAGGVDDPQARGEYLLGLLWGALSQIRLAGRTDAAAPMARIAVETVDGWAAAGV